MRVLITGGYGFIGMYATERLIKQGHDVFIFDMLSAPPAGMEKSFEGANAIKGDLLNPFSLMEAIEKNRIDRIIHLAALRNNDSKRFPYSAFKLNCEGTMNCFEAARICGIKRVTYASSVAALGKYDFFKQIGYDIDSLSEDAPCKPSNVYGVTKLFCEMMGEQYCNLYDMNIIGVRLPIIFGAGKKGGSRSSFYNELIEKSVNGEPASVTANCSEKFNIQYVKDSAKAVVCGCLADSAEKGVYNTGGSIVTMEGYVQAIKNVLPKANITIINDPETSMIDDTCISSLLAVGKIGYKPDFTLEMGIEDHARALSEK
jgi:UDP-glucose 4-epimerase